MICFRDEKATIQYLPSEQAIFSSWQGEVISEQFQLVMKITLQHMQALLPKNWLLDLRYMQAISYHDQQWLVENWAQELVKLPIHKMAIIPSFDVYNGMVIEEFLRYSSRKVAIDVQFFADYEASLAWINDFSDIVFLNGKAS